MCSAVGAVLVLVLVLAFGHTHGQSLAAVAVLGTAGFHGTGSRKRSLTCRQGRYSISRQDHISSLKSRQIEMAVDPSSVI